MNNTLALTSELPGDRPKLSNSLSLTIHQQEAHLNLSTVITEHHRSRQRQLCLRDHHPNGLSRSISLLGIANGTCDDARLRYKWQASQRRYAKDLIFNVGTGDHVVAKCNDIRSPRPISASMAVLFDTLTPRHHLTTTPRRRTSSTGYDLEGPHCGGGLTMIKHAADQEQRTERCKRTAPINGIRRLHYPPATTRTTVGRCGSAQVRRRQPVNLLARYPAPPHPRSRWYKIQVRSGMAVKRTWCETKLR